MNILYEHKQHTSEALRIFTSDAEPRRNSLRIHHHVTVELSLILKGKGIYKSNGNEYLINEGDIFLFRPNEAHCITDIYDGGMTLLNIHIAPNYLYTNFPSALSSDYIKILATNFKLQSSKINDFLSEKELCEIRLLILCIKEECTNRQSDFLTLTVNNLCNIFIMIARPYSKNPFPKNKRQSYQNIVSAISYIDSHFSSQITLDDLASYVGYSRSYFSDVFKKCLGMSVWEYICIKRIEEALHLIKTTNKNILQIATECGFNNTANFNKMFKKYTHLSPHDFRK